MSFLKNIFGRKEKENTVSITTYDDFWEWFRNNERAFFSVVKQPDNVNRDFFTPLAKQLGQIKSGFYFLCGMYNDETAELILTADGIFTTIAFVEELVAAAPQINGWKFTALKQPLDIENVRIDMGGLRFDRNNLSFYANENADYPDEIDITIVYQDYSKTEKTKATNGVYIFLDSFLGELESVTALDNVKIIGPTDAENELVPIEKLKDFLIWRQKEFIEKYEGVRHNTENDNYSALEARLENDLPLIAIINTDLLSWDKPASHPWITVVTIKYDGSATNGMPNEATSVLLNTIEDDLMAQLKDFEGYLNIGRQTAAGEREIYFACKDFRKPSKVLYQVQKNYKDKAKIEFDIYKDKYWQSFRRFQTV